MSQLIKIDAEYKAWIEDIGNRYHSRQVKASVLVNQEMLRFYWSIGQDIVNKKAESKWGSSFFDALSRDMKNVLPGVRGLSASNLRYMKRFYELYDLEFLPQVVEEIQSTIENSASLPDSVKISEQELFSVPWGHHRTIIDKCKGDTKKAISNFQYSLPEPQSGLAQEITKDPYNFDFISIREDYDEKSLKDALMDNITKFLLELGKGFAFVGREYKLPIDGTEEFIDLLFYHLHLHCYVVVEVKIVPFTSRDIGQVGTYVNIVDDLIRTDIDTKTIGLIICKSKNNVLAKYAVNSSKEPIGISSYELSRLLPAEYKDSLPTIEEIEQELGES